MASTHVNTFADVPASADLPIKVSLNQLSDIFTWSLESWLLQRPTSTSPTGLSFSVNNDEENKSTWSDTECVLSWWNHRKIYKHHLSFSKDTL